ncbi:MAG: hypothetical protein ABIR77_08310 [Sphingomicrobium sp.]
MNPFEFIALIVAIVVIGNMLKSRRARRDGREELVDVTPADSRDNGDTRRLRDEVNSLKQRIQVLERIAVEKESSLEREIEQLRDR